MWHRVAVDPATQASWLYAVPAIALVTALLLAPGWIVSRSFGLDRLDALGVAPAAGTAIVLGAATAVDASGARWSAPVGLATVVLVTALASFAGKRLRGSAPESEPSSTRQRLALLVAVGLGVSVTSWQLVSGTEAPDALAQMPDAPFHLVAVQHLVMAASGSPWHSGEALWYVPGSFYPGGFHSLAATAALWTGVDVDVACHAVLLVLTAVAWPLSLVLLARTVLPRSGWAYLGAGVLVIATCYSTLALLPVGAAWANAASASLLPALLIPLIRLVQHPRRPSVRELVASLSLVTAGAAAAVLCQPNAVFGLALLGLPIVGPRLVSWGRWWAAAWLAAVVATAGVWMWFFPPTSLDVPVNGDPDLRRSALLVLKNGDVPLMGGAVVLLLVLAGLVHGVRRVESLGLVLAWGLSAVLLLAVTHDTGLEVQRIAWPWYSGFQRISVVWAIPAYLVAACGLAWVVGVVRARARAVATPLLALGVAGLLASTAFAVVQVRDAVHLGYVPSDPDFTYVTTAEVAALEEVAAEVDGDGATALDPFRGGMYLSMFGHRTIPLVPFSTTSKDGELIDLSLDRAASDASVCDAVRRLGVTHVLTGGSRAKYWSSLDPQAPGIDGVPGADGFTQVASAAPYVLWTVPRECR